MANIQLPALPQGVGGPDAGPLVLAINDRLRRISTALQQIDTATAAAPPASGTSTGGDDGDDAVLATWLADRAPVALAPPPTRDLLANIPTGLNAGDAGRMFYATDYQHTWRWTGTAWAYGDGDPGSGFISWFMVAPRSGKWQLCDGSASISESHADGTVVLVNFASLPAGTMPDLRGIYLRGAVAASGVITPPASSAMTVGPADVGPTPGSVAAGTGSPASFLTGLSNNPHTHSITGPPEPGHIDAMPYYRL